MLLVFVRLSRKSVMATRQVIMKNKFKFKMCTQRKAITTQVDKDGGQ